jgi:hypothetical protein
VKSECMAVRRQLEEGGGGDAGAHLEVCPACLAHAELLRVLESVEVREDPDAVQAILAALPPAPWRQRAAGLWLPLVAGFALMVTGLVLLGGMPAGTAVAALPAALGAWMAAMLMDTVAVAESSSGAARFLLAAGGGTVIVSMLLALLGGGWGVWALARARRGGDG